MILYKINEIINKFLLAGDKFKPEIHLKDPQVIYSAFVRPFTKGKEIIQKLKKNKQEIQMEGRNLKQMLLILLFQFAFNSAFVANVRTFFLSKSTLFTNAAIAHLSTNPSLFILLET